MPNQTEFVHFLVQAGALRFGDFTTKSGRKTPYFINTGEFRTGESMAQLATWYAHTFQNVFGDSADNLYGPAYKGIPLCATTAMALQQQFGRNLSFTYNRKEAKDHGEGGMLVTNQRALYERCISYGFYERTGAPSRGVDAKLKALAELPESNARRRS